MTNEQYDQWRHALHQRQEWRTLFSTDTPASVTLTRGGEVKDAFGSNNYLGLAGHPAIKRAAIAAIRDFGMGAGASRLLSGNVSLYERLESHLSRLKSTEGALVFSSGYLANLGALGALVEPGQIVLCDRLNHASLWDAVWKSRGICRVYPHRDVDRVRQWLKRRKSAKQAMIVTDGVFSMEGDIAPLPDLLSVANEYDAKIYLDDAHGTGLLGPKGEGTCAHFNLTSPRIIQMGTLSKALGSIGGFVATHRTIVEYFIHQAKPFVYTTALPPAALAAAIAAIEWMQNHHQARVRLWRHTRWFHGRMTALGFDLCGSETPIIPIRIGDHEKTLRFSERLWEEGCWVPAIRPPTVPKGEARLRVSLMATHTQRQIKRLADAIETVGKELRLC